MSNNSGKRARRGMMIVLSSPSGAGKSTLTRMLLKEKDNMTMSVSATTRHARSGETEGIDYYFVSKDEFVDMIEKQDFLEHAKVFDHYYGTPRGPVEDALNDGKDVIFDIDWQGAQQLTQAAGDDLVKIFILPPNMRELESRLKSRAQDSEAVIAKRMAKSESEISHWAEYDYVVINDDVDECFDRVLEVLDAERMRRTRQTGLIPFVRELMG